MDTKTAYKLAWRAYRLVEYRQSQIYKFSADENRALLAMLRDELGSDMIDAAWDCYAARENSMTPFLTADLPRHIWTWAEQSKHWNAAYLRNRIPQYYAEIRHCLP